LNDEPYVGKIIYADYDLKTGTKPLKNYVIKPWLSRPVLVEQASEWKPPEYFRVAAIADG
jgi:hypothetical protein